MTCDVTFRTFYTSVLDEVSNYFHVPVALSPWNWLPVSIRVGMIGLWSLFGGLFRSSDSVCKAFY